MRGQPTTSWQAGGRRSRGSLSERLRAWRRQPRKQSPHLYWGLLAVGALLDAFVIGLTVGMVILTWPWRGLTRIAADVGPGLAGIDLCQTWIPLLTACALGFGLAVRKHRPRAARLLEVAGLVGCLAVTGAAAGVWGQSVDGSARQALAWVALLASGLGALMSVTHRSALFAFFGAMISCLGLLLADRWPTLAAPRVPGWEWLRAGDPWQAACGLSVLAGFAALALAWGLGHATLGLIAVAPHRRSLIRGSAECVGQALGWGVLLLGAGAVLGGAPVWDPTTLGCLAVALPALLLLHARFAGWVQDLGLALGCLAGPAAALLAWSLNAWLPTERHGVALGCLGWMCCATLAGASLSLHAMRRYWFACPPRA